MSQDPVRLLDDPSLPDLLRQDLAEAANQPPPALDVPAGLDRLRATLHAGGAGGSAAASAKAASLAQGSWWGAALIGTALGLVGAVLIWFAPAGPTPSPPREPPRIEATVVAPPPLAPPAIAPAPAPASADTGSGAVALRAPSSSPKIAADAPRSSASAAEPSADPVDPAAEELALLVRTREKAAADPAGAIALVEEGHQRFPRGAFSAERESIAVFALVQLGRSAEARARAQRFIDAHPGSPYAERLRSVAGASP